MTTWNKFTHVCESCDALIEYTSTRIVRELTCECGFKCNWLSQEPATITPTETKGNQMETTDTTVSPAVNYNPDLLVTYKVLNGYSDPEYATDKVRNIEWDLHNARQNSKSVANLQSKINTVKDIILEAYTDSDDQETLQSIAEALDIELTKDVEFTATIEVSGTITLNLLEDYELESEITDALYVDANHGNIQIDDHEVCHVREAY